MLSSAFRDARKLSSPAGVTLTYRRALPPRSPVDSPIHDASIPFSSRRRSVTYTAAGATSRPVRRAISSTIGRHRRPRRDGGWRADHLLELAEGIAHQLARPRCVEETYNASNIRRRFA